MAASVGKLLPLNPAAGGMGRRLVAARRPPWYVPMYCGRAARCCHLRRWWLLLRRWQWCWQEQCDPGAPAQLWHLLLESGQRGCPSHTCGRCVELVVAVAAVLQWLLRWLLWWCLAAGRNGLSHHIDVSSAALAGAGSSLSVGTDGGAFFGAAWGCVLGGVPHACWLNLDVGEDA